MTKPQKPDLWELAEKWPSPYVARKRMPEFTGGGVSVKYMANRDYEGTGPEGRFVLNGNIMYPVKTLIPWLAQNVRGLR